MEINFRDADKNDRCLPKTDIFFFCDAVGKQKIKM